jgi:hypothetical protein
MARVSYTQTALNAGELSEQMEGRATDFQKYRHGMRKARNVLLSTTGSAYTRMGTRYIRELKSSAVQGRLWGFIAGVNVSDTQSYMIEWADEALRVIKYHAAVMANNVTSTITNGTFTSNINDWDDISPAGDGLVWHDSTGGRLALGQPPASYTEEVFNDDMSADDWTNPGGWTYDAANDEYDASATFNDLTYGGGAWVDLIEGETYDVEVDISAYTGGTYRIELTGGSTMFGTTETPTGVETITTEFTITNGDKTGIIFSPMSSSTYSVTAVRVVRKTWNTIPANGSWRSIAEQDVTTAETSTEHVVRFKVEGTNGASAKIRIGDGTGEDDILRERECGLGCHCVAFTPGASPYYLQFISDMQGEAVYIDDVEILDNVPIELTSPYAEADLYNMRFNQSNDVQYITVTDGSIRPYRLERYGDSSWSLVEMYNEDGPWNGINPSRRLSEDQLVPDGYFEEGIEGWSMSTNDDLFYDGEGKQLVTSSRNSAPAAQRESFNTDRVNGVHVVHINTTGGYDNNARHIFKIGSAAGGTQYVNETGLEPGWYSVKFTPTGAALHLSFTGTSRGTQTAGLATCLIYHEGHNLLEVDGTSGSVTVTAHGDFKPFQSTDVGRALRLEWPGKEAGWGIITAVTDSQTATVQTRRDFAHADVPTETWRFGTWSDTDGWPTTSSAFEGRSVWNGGPGNVLEVIFSQSSDLENFRPDSFESGVLQTLDDDALYYFLASPEHSKVNWLIGDSQLIIGTEGGQWVMRSDGITITATDVDAKKQTQIRASDLQPIPIGDTGIYVEAGKRRIYDIGYSIEADQFVAADITVLAEHVFRQDRYTLQPVYQMRPDKNVWFPRSDGKVAVLKYDRTEGIVGWTIQEIAGSFGSGDAVVECVAVKPGSDDTGNGQVMDSGEHDEVWMIVKRTIDGNTVRYIEVLEGRFEGALRKDYSTEALWAAQMVSDQEDAFHVDSGITITQASSTAVSGLGHLEGESVVCLNNGVVEGPHTVSSGAITLDTAGTKIQIGLAINWEIESGSMPFGARLGSAVGNPTNFDELSLMFRQSGGDITVCTAKYDEYGWGLSAGEPINWAHPQSSSKTPLWTGLKRVDMEGSWEDDQSIHLSGSDPLPVEILAMTPIKDTKERKGGR